MAERKVFGAYYISGRDLFVGSVDSGGSVTVCSMTLVAIGGPSHIFFDSNSKKRPIDQIFVKMEDFDEIHSAFRESGLSFASA